MMINNKYLILDDQKKDSIAAAFPCSPKLT